MELKNLSPMDIAIYKNYKQTLEKIKSLEKLWKDAPNSTLKMQVKKALIELINQKFQGVEKHCVFLGQISAPYTMSRIRKELETKIFELVGNQCIQQIKEEDWLQDDLDIYFCMKHIKY
jgi:hypothetical protein